MSTAECVPAGTRFGLGTRLDVSAHRWLSHFAALLTTVSGGNKKKAAPAGGRRLKSRSNAEVKRALGVRRHDRCDDCAVRARLVRFPGLIQGVRLPYERFHAELSAFH